MENGRSLLNYLLYKYPELDGRIIQQQSVFEKSDKYLRLLNESIIIEEYSVVTEDYNYPYQFFEGNSYVELVDSIIAHLIRENSQNSLVNGYHDPSSNSIWGSKVFNPYVSFQINFLKNDVWNRLFNRIGKTRFLNLILATRCFIKTNDSNYVQLFGHLPSFQTKTSCLSLKSRMMYKNKKEFNNSSRFFSDNPIELIDDIIPSEVVKSKKNLPKRLRPLKKLCKKIIYNDAKTNYLSIYKEVRSGCLQKIPKTNFEYATLKSVVIRFVLIAVGKIFPLSTWGTPKNKSVIIEKVIKFIKAGKNDKFPKDQLIYSIELSTINWLGKIRKITSKQDYELRENLLLSFVEWFLSVFVCDLVGSFWYVTEVSHGVSSKGLLYYPQNDWKMLTNGWLNSYVNNYLTETSDAVESEEANIFKKYNIGRLRLLPKLNDFRVLCIPIRQTIGLNQLNRKEKESEKFQYLSYMNNTIKPIRELLIQKEREKWRLNKTHPRCVSLSDMVYNIGLFKDKLRHKHTKLPKLFMLKFDMTHCFDNLNQEKILKSVEQLFAEDEDDKTYYIRQFVESSTFKQEQKKQRYIIKDGMNVQEFNILNGENSTFQHCTSSKIIMDKTKTFSFSKAQVLGTIREHVLHSSMILPNNKEKYFRRKRGVFQGFPLLAALCELVYNSLVDDNFQFLLNDNSDSILLRLVDDFLVISTERYQCKRVYDIVLGEEFRSSGAFVNAGKTCWVDDKVDMQDIIKFVGLRIKPETLEIMPDANSNSTFISLSKCKSFKAVYLYLQWCYKIRLADHFINLKSVSQKVAMENIAIILGAIIESYYIHFKEILIRLGDFDEQSFQEFLLNLLHLSLRRYEIVNSTRDGAEELILTFRTVMNSKLAKNSAFKRINTWLSNSKMI